MTDRKPRKDRGCKVQGRVPAYDFWVIQKLIERGILGYNESNAVSNLLRDWLADRRPLVRKLKLSEADYEKATAAGGPVVPFPRRPREPSGHRAVWPRVRSRGALGIAKRGGART